MLGWALPAAAQEVELTESHSFDSGATFRFPGDWTVEDEGDASVTIASELTQVTLLDYAYFEAAGVADTGAAKSTNWYFEQANPDAPFDRDAVEEIELGERTAQRYDYEDGDGNAAVLLTIPFSNGDFGVLDAVSLDGAMQEEDIVLAIAESFDSGGARTFSGGAAGETTASTGTPCTVSTSESRTVRVRVGAGENRTSYAFLPANQSFEVLGQAAANDDSLWWKLDRETVAPNAAANEAWVAQEDVEEAGDCGAVVDVNAPPIIPIVSAPPPEPTAAPGGETQPGEPPSEGGTSPTPGSWTIVFTSHVPASCLGTETIYLDIPIPSETYSLSGGGSSIVYGGSRLNQTRPGVYSGLFNFPDGFGGTISAEIILRVQSPTYMTGEIIFTEVFNDTACSITIPVTVTRN